MTISRITTLRVTGIALASLLILSACGVSPNSQDVNPTPTAVGRFSQDAAPVDSTEAEAGQPENTPATEATDDSDAQGGMMRGGMSRGMGQGGMRAFHMAPIPADYAGQLSPIPADAFYAIHDILEESGLMP